MKRAEALSPLSRDHHRGLFVALRLKRAESGSALEARDAFVEFWNAEGREHFRTEEEILLPAFARYAQHDHPAVARVLVEHVDLRRRGADIATAEHPDPESLHELGERLESHIRHEERVLFPLIEQAMPSEQLEQLDL